MDFTGNIFKNLGVVAPFTPLPYRATILGGCAGYFENVKGIKSFSKTEIILYLKKGELTVSGENLSINKFCLGDLMICGNITCVKASGV